MRVEAGSGEQGAEGKKRSEHRARAGSRERGAWSRTLKH